MEALPPAVRAGGERQGSRTGSTSGQIVRHVHDSCTTFPAIAALGAAATHDSGLDSLYSNRRLSSGRVGKARAAGLNGPNDSKLETIQFAENIGAPRSAVGRTVLGSDLAIGFLRESPI